MAKSAVDLSLTKFQKELILYRNKVIARANGRTCGSCRFFISGVCVEQDIEIYNTTAIACGRHKRRRNVRKSPRRENVR